MRYVDVETWENKKILYIHHGQVTGGAPTSLRNMLLGLRRAGFSKIKVLCLFPSMREYFSNYGFDTDVMLKTPPQIIGRFLIGYYQIGLLFFYAFIREFLAFGYYANLFIKIRNERPYVVHLNSSILLIPACIVKLLKVKLVWHVREHLQGGKWNLKKWFAGWLIRRIADQVICISEAEQKSLGSNTYKNVHVVYNFIDFSRFLPDRQRSIAYKDLLGLKESNFVVLSLGGVSVHKGVDQLLEALPNSPENIRLLVAGTALRKNMRPVNPALKCGWVLEDIAIRFGCKSRRTWAYERRVEYIYMKLGAFQQRVQFIGVLDDVVPLIDICDLLVFAGTMPHFPRPVFEAWAMSKPVLVLKMSGISDHIKDGVNGFVNEMYQPKMLSEKLNKISAMKTLGTIGCEGQKKALELFSQERNVREIIQIYSHL